MKIEENIPLSTFTTFRIGGNARYFCVAKSEDDLKEALAYARARSLPLFILGGGSNLLVSDAGFTGLVVKMEIGGISVEKKGGSALVTAFAGESWDALVAKTVNEGLWGLENLSVIPGTVGAAPVQNIGAYGTEVKDTIESVTTIDARTGEKRIFSNAECEFSYRESVFKRPESKNLVILSVVFCLTSTPRPNLTYKDLKDYFEANPSPTLLEIREGVMKIRKGKFPDLRAIGTAGSFWKNPVIDRKLFETLSVTYPGMPSFPAGDKVKVPLAWILDRVCDLKGHSAGNVALFQNQPLVLVAKFGATKSEVDTFADHVVSLVREKTGIEIEKEVQTV